MIKPPMISVCSVVSAHFQISRAAGTAFTPNQEKPTTEITVRRAVFRP